MKKILSSLFLASSLSFAGLVDAIALVVNDEPITLYEIDEKIQKQSLSKSEAVSNLVDEILYKQELKKKNIHADIFDVNNYVAELAQRNGMDVYSFKSIVKQRYGDFKKFEDEIKQKILRDKLTSLLVRGKLKVASEDDLKIYYNNNQNKYATASSIEVVQYFSRNKRALATIKQNPLFRSNDVFVKTETLNQAGLNPQLKYLLNDTKKGSFTPIFTANGQYVMLFVKDKSGVATQSFEAVKNSIFQEIMKERESQFLKEYFEKLKITAEIKVIR